jgi:hypothetical protein
MPLSALNFLNFLPDYHVLFTTVKIADLLDTNTKIRISSKKGTGEWQLFRFLLVVFSKNF